MVTDNKTSLTSKIIISMVLGIATGAFLQWLMKTDGDFVLSLLFFELSFQQFFVNGLFEIGGQLFVASLKMLVVPLVFVSLICGTCSLQDTTKLGKIGGKAIGLYLCTTAIAISLAMAAALVFQPGVGVNMTTDTTFIAKEAPKFTQVIIDMFPSNPFSSFAEGNMLQVIIFSLLFGIAMALSGKAGDRLAAIFNDLNTVIMRLVTILMNLAPYGVFCLLAKLFTEISWDVISNLLGYFVLVFVVLIIHALVTYSTLLKLLSNLSPVIFIKKMRDAILFAFSTSSSGATIPVTLETATKKMGANNSIASFTVPLGATINMDGTAIMQGVATVFIAQAFNIDLTFSDFLLVILTATLASIGTAGVPGVGLIMLAMVLEQVGLPVEGIALIIGVDRLLDMTRTAVNVTGDCMTTLIVAKSEKELDIAVFNDADAGKKIEEIDFTHLKKS